MVSVEGLDPARPQAAPTVARRYLLISSAPHRLAGLIACLCAEPAELTLTAPGAVDRHRVLALRPDIALLHVSAGEQLRETVRELRNWSAIPAIPLLALVDQRQLDAAELPAGVDDFVVEPWEAGEVLLRLRRFAVDTGGNLPAEVLEAGPVTLDLRQQLCLVDGERVDLTFIEFAMLKALIAQPNRFLAPAELVRTVWDGRQPVHMVTLRVWIKRLRDKLPAPRRSLIETRRSVGYRYALDAAPLPAAV